MHVHISKWKVFSSFINLSLLQYYMYILILFLVSGMILPFDLFSKHCVT